MWVIHTFFPALDVVEIAKQVGATRFLELISDAGLSKTLKGLDNFTLFLPTNEAIDVSVHLS